MFEYLMPLLVMRSYPETLLDETCRMAVRRQIEYGAAPACPGAFPNRVQRRRRHGNYQYRAFGVPGLGLKRGLGDDLVVAPYATALAAMIDPDGGRRNLRRLARPGPRRAVRLLRRDRLHAARDDHGRERRTRRRPPDTARSCAPSWPITRA